VAAPEEAAAAPLVVGEGVLEPEELAEGACRVWILLGLELELGTEVESELLEETVFDAKAMSVALAEGAPGSEAVAEGEVVPPKEGGADA